MSSSSWTRELHHPRSKEQTKLFCFPFAGGRASIFRGWSEYLAEQADLYAVELPGHGDRLGEPAFSTLPALVQAVANGLRERLDGPFALFGHSMGALLAFELARYLRSSGQRSPGALFVSAYPAPQTRQPGPLEQRLDDAGFLAKLGELNGTPAAVLEQPELMELLLPTLRADFDLCDSYSYVPQEPLDCSIFAYGGVRDAVVTRSELAAWREQTRGEFRLRTFDGGHFYWLDDATRLLGAVSAELRLVV